MAEGRRGTTRRTLQEEAVPFNLNRLRISGRIFAGFGAVIALLAVISGLGLMGLSNVGASVGRLSAVSDNLQRMLQTEHATEAMRLWAIRYKAVHDREAIPQFNEAHKHAVELLGAAA